jgi:hypothetical protein
MNTTNNLPVAKCVYCTNPLTHPTHCTFCGQRHHETTLLALANGQEQLSETRRRELAEAANDVPCCDSVAAKIEAETAQSLKTAIAYGRAMDTMFSRAFPHLFK